MDTADIKNAAITTVTVLVVIFALNQIAFTKPLVQRALMG